LLLAGAWLCAHPAVPTPQVKSYFPNMALTLVRRATAELPKNTYLFRCDPKYTKLEIKEYLQKLYNVKVASVSTINSLGTPCGWPLASRSPKRGDGNLVCCRRVCPHVLDEQHCITLSRCSLCGALCACSGKLRRSGMHTFKQTDFKKVYVRIAEDTPAAGSLERV
jgi:ribosomal protein L23